MVDDGAEGHPATNAPAPASASNPRDMDAGPSGHPSSAQGAVEMASKQGAALPHTEALDHDNAFLSPVKVPSFDVDDFLISRVPGATLGSISSELVDYGEQLQQELGDVVDRDFRGFVNLGAALKAEGPRIARLDWKMPRKHDAQSSSSNGGVVANSAHTRADSIDSHYDVRSNLGLQRVRDELVRVRDDLCAAEQDIRATMARKDTCERSQEDLKVLLSFDDSICRLEDLLLPDKLSEEKRLPDSSSQIAQHNAYGAMYWRFFTNAENDDDESDSEGALSDVPPEEKSRGAESPGSQGMASPALSRKSLAPPESLLIPVHPEQLANGTSEWEARGTKENGADTQDRNLPNLISRASSEHAALQYLQRQARALGFQAYLDAHSGRLEHIRRAIRDAIEELVRALTDVDNPSLLVQDQHRTKADEGAESTATATRVSMLRAWHQKIGPDADERAEQSSWLELAITTWNALPSESEPTLPGRDTSNLEEVIRQSLMAPALEKIITARSLQREALPEDEAPMTLQRSKDVALVDADLATQHVQGDGSKLISLYNSILLFASDHTSIVSRCAERAAAKIPAEPSSAGQPEYCDIFVRCVWRAIANRLTEQLGGQLFFVGRPSEFQRNYTITMLFLEQFEKLAPSQRAAMALRNDSTYQAFKKRWQLPVYFQMRLREAVSKLEIALAQRVGDYTSISAAKSASAMHLPLSKAAQACSDEFLRPWRRGRHIPDLAARQWRLSLQVIARFRTFVSGEIPRECFQKERRSVGTNSKPAAASNSGTLSPARSGTPQGREGANNNSDDLTSLCTALTVDIIWFESRVREQFETSIIPTLAQCGKADLAAQVLQSLRDSLHESTSMQRDTVPLLQARVVATLKAQCAEPLRLVRSLSSQYRTAAAGMTHSKATGSTTSLDPSYFVSHFLRPLRQFLGKSEGGLRGRASMETRADNTSGSTSASTVALSALLPRQVREDWVSDVVEDFVARYTASLQTMNKNFESLQRLKRVNATGSSATSGGASEDESAGMHAQMRADVDALEQEIKDFQSVDTNIVTDTPAWFRLRQAASGMLEE